MTSSSAARDGSMPGVTAQVFTFVFINAGRGPRSVVKRLWAAVAAASGRRVDVVLAVEVDEADTGYSDHHLIRRFLARFVRVVFRRHREVILVRPGLRVLRTWAKRAGRSVAGWSPTRYVVGALVDVGDGRDRPDVVAAVTHLAAAQDNGHRPQAAVEKLQASQGQTHAELCRQARAAHDAGRHFVTALDSNLRHLPPIHPAEVVIFTDAPDDARAVPAPGWHVADVEHHTFPNPLEPKVHPGHWGSVTFEKERTS